MQVLLPAVPPKAPGRVYADPKGLAASLLTEDIVNKASTNSQVCTESIFSSYSNSILYTV